MNIHVCERMEDVRVPTKRGSVSLQVVANNSGNYEVYDGRRYECTVQNALQHWRI